MKRILTYLLGGAVCFGLGAVSMRTEAPPAITISMARAAQQLLGLQFSDVQLDSARRDLEEYRANYEAVRKVPLPNSVAPAVIFNPMPVNWQPARPAGNDKLPKLPKVRLPANRDDLAFYSVRQLGELLRTRQISSEELTRFFLERLRRFDAKLHCVTTLTEELALQQARAADAELRKGKYRGPLHGIPYGVKDLFSTKTYKTTWGSVPYQDQVLDEDAAVVVRLREAGAVLVAKLTLGELAMGDVWYGGKTRTPWNVERGSSGSSAGSASAVAGGLLPFALGTETLGSIVSPSTACGVTGLRPTFGRVSRAGAMALSWTMDKVGPIARSAEDCAVVFDAIEGPDRRDPVTLLGGAPAFRYAFDADVRQLRVGYLKADFDKKYGNQANDLATLEALRRLGVTLVPLELPQLPTRELVYLLTAEGATAFDDLTRSGRDRLMVQQDRNAWPTTFRSSRFIPAVEYLQAQRVRTLLIEQMAAKLQNVDVYLAPSFASSNLVLTNLTGHPAVAVPNGFTEKGLPQTITFTGQLFGEDKLLALVKAYQDASEFDEKHPPMNF